MIKKGIFGGTFDPIHNGHLYIAQEALDRLSLSKVIFMPSGTPPHKTNKEITDGSIRYEMVKMAIRQNSSFEVSDYEIKKRGLSFTYETLEYFQEIQRGVSWHFITGADCLMDLDSWRNVDRILNSCTLVVFGRPGHDKDELLKQKKKIEAQYKKEIIFMDLLQLDISSSNIRESINNGKRVDYFLPHGVYNSIMELGLYRKG